jgi:hypothetical protein
MLDGYLPCLWGKVVIGLVVFGEMGCCARGSGVFVGPFVYGYLGLVVFFFCSVSLRKFLCLLVCRSGW